MSEYMIRFSARILFLFCIVTIALMGSPVIAGNPGTDYPGPGQYMTDATPESLMQESPSMPSGLTLTGGSTLALAKNGSAPSFAWAVPDAVGVHPFTIAVDAQDTIYAADPIGHSIGKFSPEGSRISQWGSAGNNPGEFRGPAGVAVNSSGYVYTSDLDRIQVFGPDGTFVTAWGSAGNNTGEFNGAIGIAVNASGYVYVSETSTNRIQVFDPAGTFVTAWGTGGSGPGEFNGLVTLAVNTSGFVYAVDRFNNRIQVFDPSGRFVQAWNRSGSGNGELLLPESVTIDRNGTVFVGDAGNNRVQVFDPSGMYVKQFPVALMGLGIAVNSSGYVYLTDAYVDRISVLDQNGAAVRSWGARGDGNGRFFHPWGVAVNASGYSYVTDSENNQVQIISPAGTFVGQWGSQGSDPGKFALPLGIAADSSGYVYTADSGNNRVQVFDPSGRYEAQWGSFGYNAGELFDPRGIAVNHSGFVYVSETGNARIQVFTRNGTSLGYWGTYGTGTGQFSGPMGIAINESGYVFVGDDGNHRVQVFDPSGGYVMQIGSHGTGDGMFSFPMGVAVDTSGRVFVVDQANHRIQFFTRDGVYQGQWGSTGTNNGQFYDPAGIAADKSGNVVVAEWMNDRIQKFTFSEPVSETDFEVNAVDVNPPGDLGSGNPVTVSFTVNFSGTGNQTFPSAGELQMSTDLDNARWNYTLILDGVENPQPGSGGRTLNVSGWLLSFPPSVRESLNVTLHGTAPGVPMPADITIVDVREIDSYGNPVGTPFSRSAPVSPGEVPPGEPGVIPLCPAGTPFDGSLYPQNTPQSDPMVFQCYWNGTGRVYMSGNQTSVTGIWADDGYTVTIQPSGATFDAPDHGGVQHPVVDLTSGMTPGVNNFTLVVQNWNGLSMWYGLFAPLGISQTPYVVQVINASEPSGLYADFDAFPVNGTSPLVVHFSDTSYADNSAIAGRAWFFGDENYTGPWIPLNGDTGWPERYLQSSAVMPDGSIIMTGGMNSGTFMDDVWRSTDTGETWTEVTDHAGWPGRAGHSSAALPDGSIVIMGGTDGSNNYRSDVWRSADNGLTWTEVTDHAGWPGRAVHSSVVLPDGSLVVMGGNNGYAGRLSDVWRSTDNGATWTQQTGSAEWTGRWSQSSVAMPDGSIILTGGWNNNYLGDVWRSADAGRTWTLMNVTPGWTPRGFHGSVAMPDGSLILMGGIIGEYANSARNDIWRSTDNGATWTQLTTSAAWVPRYYPNTLVLPDGSIVLIGGMDDSGTILSDVWRFQPAGSSEMNPSHTFTVPGTYTVSLQVFNNAGSNSTQKPGYITVTRLSSPRPVVKFTSNKTSGYAPLAVKFTDSTTGSPIMWNWSFGDDTWFNTTTASQKSPAHVYTNAGTFNAQLIACNASGCNTTAPARTITVTIQTPPVVKFTTNKTSGYAPLAVKFTDSTTGSPIMWNWSFGDDTWFNTSTSSEKSPTHIYTNAGTFNAQLIACNAAGCNVTAPARTITVTIQTPPVVKFTSNKTSGFAPLAVKFTDSTTGSPTMWNWSFGDNTWFNTTISGEKSPTHIYTNAGTFNAQLIACNAAGCNTTAPLRKVTVRG